MDHNPGYVPKHRYLAKQYMPVDMNWHKKNLNNDPEPLILI